MSGIKPEQEKAIHVETSIAEQVAFGAKTLRVDDQAGYEQAGQTLLQIQSKLKSVEAMRTSFTQPLNQVLRALNAQFKPPKAFYTQAKHAIQQVMRSYMVQMEAQKQQALLVASKASDANDPNAFYMQAQIAHDAEVHQTVGVHTREVWKFEITDLTKVPLNYLLPNEAALRAFAKESKGTIEMPGVRVYKEVNVVARG